MQDYLAKDALAEVDKLGIGDQLRPQGHNSQYPTIANDQTGLEQGNIVVPRPGFEGLRFPQTSDSKQ